MSRYLIIGGVAGGATAAARLRRNDEHAEIVLIERGSDISYANCGLPYYIGDKITERDRLFVQTKETFGKRYRVDVRTRSEVLEIYPQEKRILVKNLKTSEVYSESYNKLLLSPGASPLRPPIPGAESERVFTLRNVPDTDQIKHFVTEHRPKHAVIIGAGFIGLEMAENLHRLGLRVTIVELADQVMNLIDFEMAAMVHQHLKVKGVEFYLKDGVKKISESKKNKLRISLNSQKELETDLVILSIGVTPENRLAKQAGLALGKRGGIKVNEFLQTSDSDIYAIGDAIEVMHPVLLQRMLIPLAGPANKQGRIAADNMTKGNQAKYPGSIGTAIAKVFDLTVATTGASEKLLRQFQIPYQASITHGSSHAGYYPDSLPMTIKILFAPETGVLLGAQIVGFEGVDKRIDVMATLIKLKRTVADLTEFEHSYAPPYSSAKDPLNVAGFVAENMMQKIFQPIAWHELLQLEQDSFTLVDVRSQAEFQLGSIEDAINIPLEELRENLRQFDKQKKVVLMCSVGLRSYVAARIMMQRGFKKVLVLAGGYKTYEHATQTQSNEDIFSGDEIGKDDMIYHTKEVKRKKPQRAPIVVDACGLQCPGPIVRLKEAIDHLGTGEQLEIRATDPGFARDIQAWSRITQHPVLSLDQNKGKITALVEKNNHQPSAVQPTNGEHKTLVVFSDNLDRALASFVIANGAAAMGKKVTMFFTFWGLNILKRPEKPKMKKDMLGLLFGKMLPEGSSQLRLSKLDMGGVGTALMRKRMSDKHVDSLEKMIETACKGGVEMIACQMSMEMMGIREEELIDGVKVGGVATYLEEAEQSNLNLFI